MKKIDREELIIGTKASLKIQIRHLRAEVTFLKNRRNIRNCEYQFVCNGKQKKGSIICDDCFEHVRKKALKQDNTTLSKTKKHEVS